MTGDQHGFFVKSPIKTLDLLQKNHYILSTVFFKGERFMKRSGFMMVIIALMAMGLIWMAMAEPETRVDPVCQMTVAENQTITAEYNGQNYYFCSEHCKQLFVANPAQYMVSRTPAAVSESSRGQAAGSGCGISARRAGCGGCPAASSCFASAAGSSSPEQSTQKSSVQRSTISMLSFTPCIWQRRKATLNRFGNPLNNW